jgi:LCP family protein required for cell wall assembly
MSVRPSIGRAAVALLAVVLMGCTAVSPTPSVSPSASPSPSPSPTAVPTPAPTPEPTRVPLDEGLLHSRFTVLVLGEDSSQARRSTGMTITRTDTMMVVSLSATQSSIVALSLPRDTVDVPMADGSLYRSKINGIAYNLGYDVARDAVATLLGIQIDGYLKIDMDDLVWLVDAVGGVDVEVKTRVYDRRIGVDLQPGPAHLDGAQALAFSRTRADSDYMRAARQQQVVLALVQRWVAPGTTTALLDAATHLGSLRTDIPLSALPTLLAMGRRATDAEATTLVLEPPRFSLFVGIEPGTARGWIMVPDVAEMRAVAQELIPD